MGKYWGSLNGVNEKGSVYISTGGSVGPRNKLGDWGDKSRLTVTPPRYIPERKDDGPS